VNSRRFARLDDVALITKSEHRRKISREALIELLGDLYVVVKKIVVLVVFVSFSCHVGVPATWPS
jgi:hypothetical protein